MSATVARKSEKRVAWERERKRPKSLEGDSGDEESERESTCGHSGRTGNEQDDDIAGAHHTI